MRNITSDVKNGSPRDALRADKQSPTWFKPIGLEESEGRPFRWFMKPRQV
jgi:hypothetical protein